MSFTFLESLSQDHAKLLESGDEYNVIIEVGEAPLSQSYKAHSVILCYRCPFLYKSLRDIRHNGNNVKILNKEHISTKVFDIIIKYIYRGIVNLEEVEGSIVFELLLTSKEFELFELTTVIESYLIENQASWLRLNFSKVIKTAFEFDEFQDLQQFCNDIIIKYPNMIFDSEGFKNLPENILISIIKRDDLQLEETAIWEYVIKWGIAQNPNLPQDIGQWSDEDFETLKIILQLCLPHIRYFQISGQEIFVKIQPYYKILEPKLWSDILSWNLAPTLPISATILPARTKLADGRPNREMGDQKKMLNSDIISEEHAAEISSWVVREGGNGILENPYKFKLLLRGSKDGFGISTFWNAVHQKPKVVVIFKVKGTNEILGGYNPIGWDKNLSPRWLKTEDSFIFSLKKENNGSKNSILSRVKNTDHAIDNSPGYCIRFGTTDFYYRDQTYKNEMRRFICKQTSYEIRIRDTTDEFSVDDYEVLQICE